ncbi:hypothetical protein Scep_025796 [Stephania cephalantha]|uniref:Uncharacterized protein n=1 Tax=Stephania cephalantha TaxID=152367 RepID=A0AAP0EM65_9MAGN
MERNEILYKSLTVYLPREIANLKTSRSRLDLRTQHPTPKSPVSISIFYAYFTSNHSNHTLKLGEINLTSIASSRFRRNRASDRSTTRHRAVHRVAATPSLVGRRRRRSPPPLVSSSASRHRWFVAADPTRCSAIAAGTRCLAGADARRRRCSPRRRSISSPRSRIAATASMPWLMPFPCPRSCWDATGGVAATTALAVSASRQLLTWGPRHRRRRCTAGPSVHCMSDLATSHAHGLRCRCRGYSSLHREPSSTPVVPP